MFVCEIKQKVRGAFLATFSIDWNSGKRCFKVPVARIWWQPVPIGSGRISNTQTKTIFVVIF